MTVATIDLPTALREVAAGLTQAEIARELDVDQATVCRILKGRPFSRRVGGALVAKFPTLRQAVADALLSE